MNKETAAALIKAHIPNCHIVSVTVSGNDAESWAAVTALHGQWEETFSIRITSIDARQLTEEEMDAGISLGSDESMRHCY